MLVFALGVTQLYGQNEINRANHWYFSSELALDFTCKPPVSVSGCPINLSEGTSAISDLAGNLLFYTDGERVWDSTHTIMPNGTGLLGHTSTVQGALIVPNPSSLSKYYIFTAGTSIEDQGVIGVRFSEVDMNLNGGNGDVLSATKNTFLFAPNEEKLTGVRNSTSTGYWVIAQEKSTNRWYAYEVTAAGVNMTPVISVTGPPARVDNSLGAKFSPNGKWLASQNSCGSGVSSNANLTVYQFNNSTGQLTYAWSDCGTPGFKLAFSNNSSKLYASGVNLYQYDLSAGGGTGIGNDTLAVLASKTLISTSTWQTNSGLQIGPGCKIYTSNSSDGAYGVINYPNLGGTACNFQPNSVASTAGGFFGPSRFPNFVQSFFEYPCSDSIEVELITSDTVICNGDSVVLEATVTDLCGYTLTWNVPLTGLGPHTVYPTVTTTYQVIASNATAADTAEVVIVVGGQNAGTDTSWSICNNETYDLDTLLTSTANAGGMWYDQSYSSISMPVNINTVGTNIYYYIIGTPPCADTAMYIINKSSSLSSIILGNDTTVCSASYLLDATTPNSTYLWSDLSQGNSLSITLSGLYWVNITDTITGCTISDSINIVVSSSIDAGRDSSALVCTGLTIDLFSYIGGTPSIGGTWLDPANNSVAMPLNLATAPSGNYSYVVGNAICGDTSVIQLININASNASFLGNDTTICISDSYSIVVNFSNSTYLWSTGATVNTETVLSPTTLYWLEITDTISTCSTRDTLNISYSPLANAGLNSSTNLCGDTIIDLYSLIGGTPSIGGNWLYPNGSNATMPIDFSVNPGGVYKYVVQSGACADTSNVTVNIFASNAINIGNDTSLCVFDSLVINIPMPNAVYNWSTGNMSSTQTIKNPGGSYDVTITDTLSGCSVSDTITVSFTSLLNAGKDSSIVLCSTNQIDLFNYLGTSATAGGNWFNSSGGLVKMPFDPQNGTYLYEVGSGQCKDTAYIIVQINTINSQFSYSPLLPYANETVVNFSNSSTSVNSSVWEIDSILIASNTNLQYTFPYSGAYTVCLINVNLQCVDTICREVEVFDKEYIYVPNSFSPNNDGYNDEFLPVITGDVEEYDLFIFNRWGQLIFETNEPTKSWNGSFKNKKSQIGSYIWRIRYKTARDVDVRYLTGHVNLIR